MGSGTGTWSNEPRSASNISADFLIGSTELGLDRIRTRLLDLTNRNKLLNFRHSPASSLRVVDVSIDTIYQRLKGNGKLPLEAVPEPETPSDKELPAKDYVQLLGWNTDFDLRPDSDRDDSLPTLYYHEDLDRVGRKNRQRCEDCHRGVRREHALSHLRILGVV